MNTPSLFVLLAVATTLAPGRTGASPLPAECADWPQKPAWEWTLDERIRHRLDQRCLRARRELAAEDRKDRGYFRTSGDPTDFVYGSDTPELFLPSQLYNWLIRAVFVADERFADFQRSRYERLAFGLGLPESFWPVVEDAAGDHLSQLRAEQALADGLGKAGADERAAILADIADVQKGQCLERVEALERTRRALPTGLFDRFLYVAVPNGIGSSSKSPVTPEMLRWRERGCTGEP